MLPILCMLWFPNWEYESVGHLMSNPDYIYIYKEREKVSISFSLCVLLSFFLSQLKKNSPKDKKKYGEG